MSYIDEIKKEREERLAKLRKEAERLDKEERQLQEAYIAAGLGRLIPLYHLGFRPSCVRKHGGAIKVYRECLKRGISWQEYCHYDPDAYDPAGCNM